MAQRFIEQAQQQVAPIYDQQIRAAQAQIPEIQNLYNTLIGGLRGESERQLATGTQGILEDAARRGVLRSTLPVDARTELQGAISSALTQGIGNLNLEQLRNVRGLQSEIGQLQLGRQGAIQSLAESLQQADLKEREYQMALELQRQQAAQSRALSQQSSAFDLLAAQIAAMQNQVNNPPSTTPAEDDARYQAWLNSQLSVDTTSTIPRVNTQLANNAVQRGGVSLQGGGVSLGSGSLSLQGRNATQLSLPRKANPNRLRASSSNFQGRVTVR